MEIGEEKTAPLITHRLGGELDCRERLVSLEAERWNTSTSGDVIQPPLVGYRAPRQLVGNIYKREARPY